MLKDRVKQVMDSESLSPKEFSNKLAIQRSSLSHIFSGRNKPSLDFIVKLTKTFPKLSMQWMLHGAGEMYALPTDTAVTRDVTNVKGVKKQTSDVNVESVISSSLDSGKSIRKIIVIYGDNTFTELDPNT